jgi:hypothetical protein
MKHRDTLGTLGAALVIAAAGIGGLIDQNTMIVLAVVLIVTAGSRCTWLPRRRA